MKCISCGGEIGLTDERCPHCGRIIKETIIKMIKEEDGGKEEDRLCADGLFLHL